ncbi:MAG TPA: 3-ketoacyl-ACP reductase [Actinobacteria bacterium]|nr:3-ketoacyl-ACP reductase [Actinomycetota bacterium]
MLEGINGKVAIITGAASYMGRAISIRLAKEGASVIVADINDEGGNETVKLITDAGDRAIFAHTDVACEKDVENTVKMAVDKFGKLDFMVNNAGGFTTGPVWELDEVKDWDFTMDLCAKGVFLGMKHAAKVMIPRKEGKIINTSSNAGKTGIGFISHYCAAKFAVVGLTQSVAQELMPYNINVNCICPGNQDHPLHFGATKTILKMKGVDIPLEQAIEEQRQGRIHQRLGKAEDIASSVAFLCSSESDYITGQSINVCGGLEFH